MKKLLFVLLFGLFFISSKSSAFSIGALDHFKYYNSDDGIASSPQPQYLWTYKTSSNDQYCRSIASFGAYSSWSSMSCWAPRVALGYSSYLKGEAVRFNVGNNDTSGYKFAVSNVKISKDNSQYLIQIYNDRIRSWVQIPTNSKLIYYDDQSNHTYDSILFWDDTVIFWDTETNETLQKKAGVDYHNGIIFADPYAESGTQNFWYIKFNTNQAWSLAISPADAGDLMLGHTLLSDVQIYDTFGPNSDALYYTISRGGNHFWPTNTKYQYNQSDDILGSSTTHTDGFIYSLQSEQVYPGDQTPGDSDSPSYDLSGTFVNSDLTDWTNYQSCIRDYSFRNFIIDNKSACNEDFQNGLIDFTGRNTVFDYVFNYADIWSATTGDYEEIFDGIDLENANGCYGLVKNAESLVALYRLQDKPYSDFQAVINQVKYMSKGSKYDYEAMCGKEPAVPTQYRPVSNSSPVCNFDSWSNFANCFAYGGSSVNSSGSSYFSLTFENAKSMISKPFHEKFIDPLKTHYDSGFAVVDVANSFICDANTVSPLPQGIGDLILVFVLSILAFILFF